MYTYIMNEYIIIATSFVAELVCKYMSMVLAIYSYTCQYYSYCKEVVPGVDGSFSDHYNHITHSMAGTDWI